jgi:hypothetical protein
MAVYTVHEPPLKAEQLDPDPERFAFVRDGFSFWAFLLTPLWMLRHQLWLVLLIYVIAVAAVQIALNAIGATAGVTFTVSALLSLLIGFEAATLRRFTLARRHWINVGIVVGDDLEAAERRFYDTWAKEGRLAPASIERAPRSLTPSAAPTATAAFQPAKEASGIIGLFPQPGAPR